MAMSSSEARLRLSYKMKWKPFLGWSTMIVLFTMATNTTFRGSSMQSDTRCGPRRALNSPLNITLKDSLLDVILQILFHSSIGRINFLIRFWTNCHLRLGSTSSRQPTWSETVHISNKYRGIIPFFWMWETPSPAGSLCKAKWESCTICFPRRNFWSATWNSEECSVKKGRTFCWESSRQFGSLRKRAKCKESVSKNFWIFYCWKIRKSMSIICSKKCSNTWSQR